MFAHITRFKHLDLSNLQVFSKLEDIPATKLLNLIS